MKIFKYVSFLLLITFIGVSMYIAVQPNTFSFNKSLVIDAPTSLVYKKVNDFKNWDEFSPWTQQHPDAQVSYGNITSGTGATYSWNASRSSEGTIKTTSSDENLLITQHLSLANPLSLESDMQWDFEPTEKGTKVTVSMAGKQNFMTKMFTVFSGSIEETLAPQLEQGLFKLDSTITADMKKYSVTVNGVTDHSGGYYLYTTTSCKIDELDAKIAEMLPGLQNYALQNNISVVGSPFVNYIKWDEQNNAVIFSCCLPTTERVITTNSDVLTGELPNFRAVKTTLKGNSIHLKEARETTKDYILKNDLIMVESGPVMEIHTIEPTKSDNPADWTTQLYMVIE